MDDKRVIKIVKRLMPSVVSIVIAEKLEDLKKEMAAMPGAGTDGAPKIDDGAADARGMVQTGGGSGFVIAPNGLILTNKHVVSERKAEYTVVLSNGREFPATILSRDPINDVAILKIAAEKLPAVQLGDATKLQLGQSLIAIGNALGIFRNTVSVGIVSGLSRSITAQADPSAPPQEMRGLIQTDAAINPGNSGGPIVDRNGRVVGVNAAIVSGAQAIGFAIPVNAAHRDIDDIKKYGRIRRPLLGVRYIMIDKNLAAKLKLPVDHGALVTRESAHDAAVVPDSPAAEADVRESDIILTINGKTLDRDHPLQDFLEKANVGDEAELKVLRGKEEIGLKLILAERK